MRGVLLLLTLSLIGCSEPMSNKEIIAEVKACEDSGLVARPFYNSYIHANPPIVMIQCSPNGR